MKKSLYKIALTLGLISFAFITYNTNVYANGCPEGQILNPDTGRCCKLTGSILDNIKGTVTPNYIDYAGEWALGEPVVTPTPPPEKAAAENGYIKSLCETNPEQCPDSGSVSGQETYTNYYLAYNPFANDIYTEKKHEWWDDIVEDIQGREQGKENNAAASRRNTCKSKCGSEKDCSGKEGDELIACNDFNHDVSSCREDCERYNQPRTISTTEIERDYYQEIVDRYIPIASTNTEDWFDSWGDATTKVTHGCDAYLYYRDMGWQLHFDGYKVRTKFYNNTYGLILWDGIVALPDDNSHQPFYLNAKLDMVSTGYIRNHFLGLGAGGEALDTLDQNGQSIYVSPDNIILTTSREVDPKIYTGTGYVDKIILDTNQLFDYYIMVTDNPDSKFYGSYHIIEEDIDGDRLEKTTKESTKIKYSTAPEENRGTNYIKRIRYSDITYKRYFETKSSWYCRLYYPNGVQYQDADIKVIRSSWPSDDLHFANQADGWAIGANVITSVRTSPTGEGSTYKMTFPYDFNETAELNAINTFGFKPFVNELTPFSIMATFHDVYEKQLFLEQNQGLYDENITHGKIIIGNMAHSGYEDNVFVEKMLSPITKQVYFNQPTPTDLEGNEVTDLKLGEWRWYEHQNGILDQVFYVQPELSYITTPGRVRERWFCIGQYHCDCEDINILCSCEDEEAGCNPDDASEDPDKCPENDAKANNKGGCEPGQEFCNEYGERVASGGRIIIMENYQGFNIPSGGCGGITGEGSTTYYEQYINSSTTLVE